MRFTVKKMGANMPLVMFLIVVIVPFFGNVFISDETITKVENRKLAEWPQKWSLSFPKEFDQFYQDHLPGREKIVAQYSKFRRDIFKVSEKVIFGEKDWLFYNSEGDGDTLADFSGTSVFSESELQQFKSVAKCAYDKLAAQGAQVLAVLPPNKSQVYPELMPEIYRRGHALTGRLEQVEAALAEVGFEVVPVKQKLKDAKSLGQPYYRTDTHWNSLGSYLGFKAIVEQTDERDVLASLGGSPSDQWTAKAASCGDIYTVMLGLDEGCSDRDFEAEPVAYDTASFDCVTEKKGDRDILRKCHNPSSASSKTVLLIGDSFLEALGPHFVNFYRKSFILDRKKNRGEISEILTVEKPTVIVVEAVERYIPLLFKFSECESRKE